MENNKVKRIYPEGKTALIKWIEDNFNNIEDYLFIANLKEEKDNTAMTIYDARSFFNAMALASILEHTINTLGENEEFVCREE